MLSEISQTEKDKYHVTSFYVKPKKKKKRRNSKVQRLMVTTGFEWGRRWARRVKVVKR